MKYCIYYTNTKGCSRERMLYMSGLDATRASHICDELNAGSISLQYFSEPEPIRLINPNEIKRNAEDAENGSLESDYQDGGPATFFSGN